MFKRNHWIVHTSGDILNVLTHQGCFSETIVGGVVVKPPSEVSLLLPRVQRSTWNTQGPLQNTFGMPDPFDGLYLYPMRSESQQQTNGVCEYNTPFMRALAMQPSSRNCCRPPDLVLWMLVFLRVFFSGGVFFPRIWGCLTQVYSWFRGWYSSYMAYIRHYTLRYMLHVALYNINCTLYTIHWLCTTPYTIHHTLTAYDRTYYSNVLCCVSWIVSY